MIVIIYEEGNNIEEEHRGSIIFMYKILLKEKQQVNIT